MATSLILPLTGSSTSTAQLVTVTDGTSSAAVKPASTAAVAADPSLVVALSPNSNSVKVTDGTYTESLFPAGFLRVTDEPTQQFYDPFDSSLDTTNRWNAAVTGNAGVAASVTNGMMSLGSGTTASGYSVLTSQPSFTPTIPAWLGNSWAMQFEAGTTISNAYRFWGVGVPQTVPTTAAPILNGCGWEIGTSGTMAAVVWAGGVRTQVATIATKPTDGAYHRYIIYYRTDAIYWYLDSTAATALVASVTFTGPQTQTLPLLAMSVGGATPPASSATLTTTGLAVWDTGKNNQSLSDGTYKWRMAQVGSNGALSVAAIDSSKASYIASASFSPTVTAATDVFTITGSASKTIRVTKLSISGTATSSVVVVASLIKRSTADTGGTPTAATAVPNDSANAAATATVASYTANPTLGNTVGAIASDRLVFAAATGVPSLRDYVFGGANQAIVLRGTAQQLVVNLNSATVAGIGANITVQWTEE